jgi:hypothetical protein
VSQEKLAAFRDRVLMSLRAQFATKVATLLDGYGRPMDTDAVLRDCANNIAQGFALEIEDGCIPI